MVFCHYVYAVGMQQAASSCVFVHICLVEPVRVLTGAGFNQTQSKAAGKQSECSRSATQSGQGGRSEVQVTATESTG